MVAEASLGGVLLVVGVGALLVGTAALVVGILTLRSARKAVGLAEDRMEYLREEQDRLKYLHEQHRGLVEELEREREEHRGTKEGLERERRERREAQQRAKRAEQEALRGPHSVCARGWTVSSMISKGNSKSKPPRPAASVG